VQAIIVKRFGGPEVLELVELPEPVPGPGEVLVQVEAIGVPEATAWRAHQLVVGSGLCGKIILRPRHTA